uniref:Polycystic kidney disease 2-like 1 protein n=1 Tax=Petromyzon marinus TaxID=7757 RepID=A0AAJ7WPY5_PETMA|nr:polycystic kidney disease 2-like 1 protein [Petromyzon marinus]
MSVNQKANVYESHQNYDNDAFDGSRSGSPTASVRTMSASSAFGVPSHKEMLTEPASTAGAGLALAVAQDQQPGCCGKVGKAIRGFWGTRLTEVNATREQYFKTTLRELIIYVVFLIDLCLLTFGMMNTNTYYYTKVMMDLFVESPVSPIDGTNFNSISSMDDFWKVVQGPVLDGLYWEKWYNGDQLPVNLSFIQYENVMLGVPRVRQLKVRNGSCTIYPLFRNIIPGCYDGYSCGEEDKETFGRGTGTAWKYWSEEELSGSSHWGLLAQYSGAGYYRDLSRRKNESAPMLQELKDYLWLDHGTRAVFIDFTTYNGNINLFCVVRLVVEFPLTGGALPSYQFRTVKLIRYVSAFDYFIMACEVIFCCFILYYVVEECLELRLHGMKYFKSVWNCLDIIVIVLSMVAIIFNICRTIAVSNLLGALLNDPNIYADFEYLAFWQTQFNNMLAINVFFAWIKIFKYVSFNKTLTQLSSTLARCAKDVLGFAVMFFIIFFAYAQTGYLVFGSQVEDFSSFVNCIFTQFRIILGDFDFHAIENANRILGPIYFTTYIFFVFFVLLNMFLAIINDTYTDVKAELADTKDDFEIGDFFKQGYKNMLNKLKMKKDDIADMQRALDSAGKHLEYDIWRKNLKQLGHSDEEIAAAFSKFDKDSDNVLDEDEQKQLRAELEGQKDKLNEDIEALKTMDNSGKPGDASRVTKDDFNRFASRVAKMESSMDSLMSKVESLLTKLEMDTPDNKEHNVRNNFHQKENDNNKDNIL